MAVAVKKAAAKKVKKGPNSPLVFEAFVKKTTPGAVQYTEDEPDRESQVSGGIYVRKAAYGISEDDEAPARIRVTIEVIDAE